MFDLVEMTDYEGALWHCPSYQGANMHLFIEHCAVGDRCISAELRFFHRPLRSVDDYNCPRWEFSVYIDEKVDPEELSSLATYGMVSRDYDGHELTATFRVEDADLWGKGYYGDDGSFEEFLFALLPHVYEAWRTMPNAQVDEIVPAIGEIGV
jgi:hypothetical protein